MEKNKNIFMAVTVVTGAVLAALGVIYLFEFKGYITNLVCCKQDKTEE